MNPEATRRLGRAQRFLDQADRYSPALAPEAVIHLSYYAMLHAAAAVLIDRAGRAPKTHGAIVGQFANLTRNEGEQARPLSRSFNRAQDLRVASDYGDDNPTESEAFEAHEAARAFLHYCRTLVGLPGNESG
ncbi:MAG: HEPN domain-containing protein [Alphaproteobacteria bacterium]|nr:HEPN domain-containing protein [Alphaproteobacteria bacterium]